MEPQRIKATLESLIFASGEPVSLARLAATLEVVPRDELRKALSELTIEYSGAGRGIVLEQVAGGFQFRTAQDHAFYVRKLLATKPPRLSRPLMETVAIIAYRQPITRPEIEALRGVDCAAVIETLLERRMVRVAGRKDAPGRPLLYATTPEFLELFGLSDLNGLPDLSELREVEAAIEAVGAGPPIDEPDKRLPAAPEAPDLGSSQAESSPASHQAQSREEPSGPSSKQG
jgi:segregation and condensation protein B